MAKLFYYHNCSSTYINRHLILCQKILWKLNMSIEKIFYNALVKASSPSILLPVCPQYCRLVTILFLLEKVNGLL